MRKELTILHVDDEDDIREVASMSFELDGMITLFGACSGREALALMEKGLHPDVILLDVMMPEMDGPSLFRQLRHCPGMEGTPVIFMTARAQGSELSDYKAMGAIGVIIKPFDPMGLAQEVRDLLAEHTRE